MTTKGFLTFAQNSPTVDYVRLAYGLALSIKATQSEYSNVSIAVTPGTKISKKTAQAFDKIIEIPYEDDANSQKWKLANEWKALIVSPYDQTIKLDSDMIFTSDIKGWWKILEKYPVWFCTNAKTYRNLPIDETNNPYRKIFRKYNLPNIYTALSFFQKSQTASLFFERLQLYFQNWKTVSQKLYGVELEYSTDVIFASCVQTFEIDLDLQSFDNTLSFVHMKNQIQGWDLVGFYGEDWTLNIKSYLNANCQLKIGNYKQTLPFHYHQKHWLDQNQLGILEKAASKK